MKIFLLFTFLLLASSVEAGTFYVDNNASGCSNGSTNYNVTTRVCSGGTQARVYVSLQAAYLASIPDDHILIRGGGSSYPVTQMWTLNTPDNNHPDGTIVNRRVFEGYQSENPIIAGISPGMYSIILKNVRISNNHSDCDSGLEYVFYSRLENVEVYENGFTGISAAGFSEFINLNVHDNGFEAVGGCSSTGQNRGYGVYTFANSGGYFFTNNLFSGGHYDNNAGFGIHCYSSCANTILENLTASGNGAINGGSGIIALFDTGIIIRNVIAANNTLRGVELGGGNGQMYNITAYNNTTNVCVNTSSGIVARNILLLGTGGTTISDGCNGVPAAGFVQSNVVGNTNPAAFVVDAPNGDFNLLDSASTLIDCGSELSPANTRAFNAGPGCSGSHNDIGAYEASTVVSGIATDSSTVDISVGSAFAPFTAISSCTGWSLTENSVARTLTSCVRTGNSVFRLACSACLSSGTTIQVSHALTSGIQDSAMSSGQMPLQTNGQRLSAWSNFTVTNNITGGPDTPVYTTKHWRCRVWNKPVTGTTAQDFYLPEDTNCKVQNNSGRIAVAFLIDCTGANCLPTGFDFEYQLNGGPGWTDVTNSCAVNAICYDNTQVGGATHGALISTTLLTNPHATYVTGNVVAQDSGFNVIDLSEDSSTNVIGSFAIKQGLTADTDFISIRPKQDSGATISHDQTLSIAVVPSSIGPF